jgi:UDP-N-acetylmuramoyl-tripeptide--D-alanyl-D-alanine ligase
MQLPDGERVAIESPLLGLQNVANALAAAAAAQAVGASPDAIAAGFARAGAVSGRLNAIVTPSGAVVVDDSYNANPGSVRAALDYLKPLKGTRILVLGDMAELGPQAVELHREIGAYAAGRCDVLASIGSLAAHAADAFGAASLRFSDIDSAQAALEPMLGRDVTVLVKASRVMGLDRLVKLLARDAGRTPSC